MKTAAKVFIILDIALTFYLIFPLIIGMIALNKLENVQNKDELTGIAICTLFFCSLLGGLFMLCIPDTEFNATVGATNGNFEQPREDKRFSDVTKNLSQLKKLLDEGIITQDIYEEKRKKYIENI